MRSLRCVYSSRSLPKAGCDQLTRYGWRCRNFALQSLRCVYSSRATQRFASATSSRESFGFQRGAAGNGALCRFRCVYSSRSLPKAGCDQPTRYGWRCRNFALQSLRCDYSSRSLPKAGCDQPARYGRRRQTLLVCRSAFGQTADGRILRIRARHRCCRNLRAGATVSVRFTRFHQSSPCAAQQLHFCPLRSFRPARVYPRASP